MFIVPLEGLPSMKSIDGAGKALATSDTNGVPVFGDILKSAISNVRETQEIAQQDSYDLAVGKTDDLHTIQINSLKASSAVELAAGITSRALTAYKEILQTQL